MIYIHVPFCRSFCVYCDFYSEIADKESLYQRYTDQLCEEIRRRSQEVDDSLKTLYFGGGTPSLLPLSSLTRILLTLEECGHGGPYTEFTMEVNPEDIVTKGLPYVQSLKALGVNRISIGVQSFDDELLKWMNRRHNAERAVEAFRIVREAGIDNISIDLIFGLSNLSEASWEQTINQALALHPQHISCYQLTVEGDSVLAHRLENGEYEEASESVCRQQYDLLCTRLAEAGFRHYEISNFALPGYEAVHNGGYWQRRPYTGFGPAAHSFSGRDRSWNDAVLDGYQLTREPLTVEDEKVETLMLALRTSRGIDAEFLFANCRNEAIDSLIAHGALVKTGRRYRVPEDHFFVADEIVRELI
ncbi:MAG: radical SAM family heme chaperone HemW [Bacteroidales bacterium]|nr:radical SAM family heme chaperone HemW [Bacteroidales bacterium]